LPRDTPAEGVAILPSITTLTRHTQQLTVESVGLKVAPGGKV